MIREMDTCRGFTTTKTKLVDVFNGIKFIVKSRLICYGVNYSAHFQHQHRQEIKRSIYHHFNFIKNNNTYKKKEKLYLFFFRYRIIQSRKYNILRK